MHVIKPSTPLPLDPAYFFGRIDASALIDLGYQDALRYLSDPRPLTAPWSADVTRMEEPAPAVTARLVVEGPFAMGPHDPGTGAALGRDHGTSLRARLRLQAPLGFPATGTVADVAGDVEVPGWAGRVLLDRGRARLAHRPQLALDLSCTSPEGRFDIDAVSCPEGLAVRVHNQGERAAIGAGILPLGPAQLAGP